MRFRSKFENDKNFLILFHLSRKHLLIIFTFEFDHFVWLSQWISQNYSIWRFLLRSRYAILVKIWKQLKLLNSVPFIKKILINQVYIRIASFWLTFTVFPWMEKNSKISQFSSSLLRFGYANWSKFDNH